ncbi:ABC transporter permease [Halobaculum limi]|uniref:ABC transporter permease n=1 Tax=Halobaculum limi TaxID=3031916 RepID=UPI002404C406|nr:ABC transporter permease subunit [Halobaculum sp. YSMS11]
MRWLPVARKELRALWGDRTVKAGTALVALGFVFVGYALPTSVPEPTMTDYDASIRELLLFVVPLFGLLLSYRAVVGERTSGRLTLVLSFPHSRGDVVLGKAAGRGVIFAGTTIVGVLLGAALVAYPFGTVDPATLVTYLGATLLFGGAYLAIGLALSTLTASLRRATVLTFGVFFLFAVAWPQLDGLLLQALAYLDLAEETLPDWARFLHGAEPGMLYRRVLDTYVATAASGASGVSGVESPWYLDGWVAVGLLHAWVVGPTLAGYLRFRGSDL